MKKNDSKKLGYLYLHIRDDINEVFYVGISTGDNFSRAYNKTNRSQWWKRITSKTTYRVEIIFKSLPIEFIILKEIEFIALYGRQILNRGPLCNILEGGIIDINKSSPKGKEFELISPIGEIIKGSNITKFCKDNNLLVYAISKVLKGEFTSHRGYKSTNTNFHKPLHRVLSPSGELYIFDNMTTFAENHGLNPSCFRSMMCGTLIHCKGWHLENLTQKDLRVLVNYLNGESRSNPGQLISPNGEIVNFLNLYKFARENNLNYNCITNVFLGKAFSHKGYKSVNSEFWKTPIKRFILSPENKIFSFSSIKLFCEKYSLNLSGISSVLWRNCKKSKGWRLPTDEDFNHFEVIQENI